MVETPQWIDDLLKGPNRISLEDYDSIVKHIDECGLPSERAAAKLEKWAKECHIDIDRPTWDETFMSDAFNWSRRSPDAQTKVGCVIASQDHHILSTGYNGCLSGILDRMIPNIRPEKYPFMIHAEMNAIFNCEHRPRDAIVYITAHPCLHCYLCMCQIGVSKIVYNANQKVSMIDEDMMAMIEVIQWLTKNKVPLVPFEYKE